jgi:hypothetical protein
LTRSLALTWEKIDRLLDDGVEELLYDHWREVGLDHDNVPLDPDWERARCLERMGILHTAALRRDGKLLGYNAFHVTPHIHYRSVIFAVNDVLFVDPDGRGIAGVKLVKGVEPMLAALGVRKVYYHTKVHVPLTGDLLGKLGYSHIENIYSKTIG